MDSRRRAIITGLGVGAIVFGSLLCALAVADDSDDLTVSLPAALLGVGGD